MSVEIAWKQNNLVTDFHLLKLLQVVFFDLVCRHSSAISADKTFAVYFSSLLLMGEVKKNLCLQVYMTDKL